MNGNLPVHQHTAACGHTPPPIQAPTCTHPHYPQQTNNGAAAKWVAIGIGGSLLAVALAVSMVAFAIGAVAVTICIVVLRSMWADVVRKG